MGVFPFYIALLLFGNNNLEKSNATFAFYESTKILQYALSMHAFSPNSSDVKQ